MTLQGAGFGPRGANKENKNSVELGLMDRMQEVHVDSLIQPRFDWTGCWQQHILVFWAIMKSNGWSTTTAALQLFAHLDGEALHVALLMPDKIRERWKDLVAMELGILAVRGFAE